MRIGMVVENIAGSAISGGRYYAMFIACGLVENGHEVTMLTDHAPRFVNDFSLYKLPTIRRVNIRSLDRAVGDYDLIIGFPILASAWALSFAKKLGVPAWNFVLDSEPLCKKWAPAVASRMHYGERHLKALKNSDLLISISESAVNSIREWTGNDSVVSLMSCVNSRIADSVSLPSPTRNLVAITRLTEHKRFSDLCYVARETGAHIDVITSFGRAEMESIIVRENCQGRIRVFDAPSDVEKFMLMKSARGFIGASAYEGLGMPFIEAVYCGLPVVCYEYPVLREVCCDAALYARHSSPESLAEKVKLLDDKYRYVELEVAAHGLSQKYSFDAFCGRVRELLDDRC